MIIYSKTYGRPLVVHINLRCQNENLIFLHKKVIIKEGNVRKGGSSMTKERLEELTQEYMKQVKARVMDKGFGRMNSKLAQEFEQVKNDIIRIDDRVLEKYREEFEFDPMTGEINASLENIINRVYSKIVMIRRELEEDKKIEQVERRAIEEDNQKEAPYARRSAIQDNLQRAIERIEQQMRARDIYGFINWEAFRVACNRVINNHIESIEQNVFEKSENDMVCEEVEKYIGEVKLEMKKERPNDVGLEFKDGPVCPIVTDTNQFAEVNKQIAKEVQESEEQPREDKYLSLPGDVIE